MTKKKPMIALTPYFNIERDEPYMRPAYLRAIRAAGGTPLILPLDLEEDDLQQIETLRNIDIFDFDSIKNEYLLEDIKKYGKQIY